MNILMLSNVQEVTRLIISEHLWSETKKSAEKPMQGASEKEAGICEELSINKIRSMIQPFISITDVLGEAYDVKDIVQSLIR